jgi:hypothetical protein
MKFSPLIVILFLGFIAAFSTSCKDEEVEHQICPGSPGGEVDLSFYVYHHDSLIPGAVIFLKYNETEFPGSEPVNYNTVIQTGVAGAEKGYAFLPNMTCGRYYVYSEGYDPDMNDSVFGGRSFEVIERKGAFRVDVFVTE